MKWNEMGREMPSNGQQKHDEIISSTFYILHKYTARKRTRERERDRKASCPCGKKNEWNDDDLNVLKMISKEIKITLQQSVGIGIPIWI